MPPRKAPARRKKSAPKKATLAVGDHELPTPVGVLGAVDVKFVETNVQKENENLRLEREDVDEGKPQEVETSVEKEKEDLQVSENVDEENRGAVNDGGVAIADSQLETVAEIKSAQEEIAAVQVDDYKIVNDNSNSLNGDDDAEKEEIAEVISVQESDISKSSCKNGDALVVEDVGNGDMKGASEVVSIQQSCENNTALAVKDDSTENVDDESDDDIEEDDAKSEGDEEASLSDDKKDKNIEIYVGKLDKDTVEDDLVKVFQQFGELKSTRIMRNSTTKKSKGFAFIRFASVDQAKHALSELKDGVEVRGKRVMISASQDNKTICLGNIHKTWNKEQVLQQLKHYGIEHIETIRVPEDPKISSKIKGFAFLEFSTHSDAVAAFQRLRKPDAVFGRDISAKVAFAETSLHSSDENLSQVNQVYLEGLAKDWNEEKVREICEKYGEILKIKLFQSTRTKHRNFGFVTFTSSESALACVEGINNTPIEGEDKIIANIAKSPQKSRTHKKGFRGGFKVEKQSEATKLNKEGEVSNSEPILTKMKGVVLNTQQAKKNKKDFSKNKIKANTVKPQPKGSLKKDAESSKEADLSKMKGDLNLQKAKRKREAASEKKLNAVPNLRHRAQGAPKKPKRGGEGQYGKIAYKVGSHKRKKASTSEAPEDGGYKNTHGKKPFKKQKGNMHGRANDNARNPKRDTCVRSGHGDHRNTTRSIDPYAPKYAASSSDAYHIAPDHLLATRRYKEMEPHAGYIEPASAKQSRTYSGYVPPVVRTPHSHQTVYLEPASTSQSRSQLYSRYLDRPVLTQPSHRGYIGTAVAHEVQPYRDYRPSAVVQIARDPYDPGLARVVRHDDRGAGVVTYVGGPPLPASQVRDRTSLYEARGSYSGAYSSGRTYY